MADHATDGPPGRLAGVKNRDQLRELASQLQSLAESGHRTDSPVSDLLREYARDWVHTGRLKASTVHEYTCALEHWQKHLSAPADSLTRADVERALDAVSPGRRPSFYSVLAAAFRRLEDYGAPGLVELLPPRPKQRQRRRALGDAEYRKLGEAIAAARQHHWARPVTIDALTLAALVPLRRGEVVSLKWNEVDTAARVIWLDDAKAGDRVVPLPPLASSLIEKQPRLGDYVFLHSNGRRLQGGGLSRAFRKIVARYGRGLQSCTLHTLRHSWATKAIREGVPMEHVRRIMGHTSQYMTARYVHVAERDIAAIADAVEKEIASLISSNLELFTTNRHIRK